MNLCLAASTGLTLQTEIARGVQVRFMMQAVVPSGARRRLALTALSWMCATLTLGCYQSGSRPVASIDVLSLLPDSVGGSPMSYQEGAAAARLSGPLPPGLIDAIRRGRVPIDSLHISVGFPVDEVDFSISGWKVPHLDAAVMVDPLIDMWAFEDVVRWQETIGGKEVFRAVPGGVDLIDGIYVYAVGDAAVMIVAEKPAEAAEALAAFP